jgi:hypothetical protein
MRRRTQKKVHKNHIFRKRFRLVETWGFEVVVSVLHRASECRAAWRRTGARRR